MSVQSVSLERRNGGGVQVSGLIPTSTTDQVFTYTNIATIPDTQTLLGATRLWNLVFSITIGAPILPSTPATDISGYSVVIYWVGLDSVEHFESQTIFLTNGERLIQQADVINVAMTWIQTESCSQNVRLQGCVLCPTGDYNVAYEVSGFYIDS